MLGGGNGQFGNGYNPICIAGPQMNKKIMRRLNALTLTDEQRAYVHHDGAIDGKARLKEMDLMGIDQVLVIPTMVIMNLPFATSEEGVDVFCQAYNNFFGRLVLRGARAPLRCRPLTGAGPGAHHEGGLPGQAARTSGGSHPTHRRPG